MNAVPPAVPAASAVGTPASSSAGPASPTGPGLVPAGPASSGPGLATAGLGLVTSGSASSGTGLVTAEAVALDLRPARLGSRAIALAIDILVELALAGMVMLVVGIVLAMLPDSVVDDALVSGMMTIVLAVVLLAYPTIVETKTNGRSPGKSAMGLRVIREDGGPITVRHAFTRSLIGFTVEWPGLLLPFLTWAGSLVTMIASDKGRRLGDLAAGTLVVHERRPVPFRFVPGMPGGLAPWAATADLSAVDDELAGQVRQYLSRAAELSEPYNSSLLHMLAYEVGARVTPPPPAGTPPWLFLCAVLAERRRRSAAQLAAGRLVTERVLPGFGRAGRSFPAMPVRPASPSR
ncbi:putative RDD family membrane protein YckC [Actinoplanes octamycinicus]|uniref:Putative RDD family membrane protein YckC n=1 Tax=Actinoplanes octamycinicus TaxID=135948 RepID=A0A7W7H3X8_9ACTN|nr:RDD family protein [Actinoplanes octamycinicus]MBB4743483.1 putative RDD family membrane protein YckC [Actinoplanes octamycinicus]GIE62531.1 transporter [Actinoplanes octamycinicus]